MTTEKRKKREDYPSDYEFRRSELWKEIKSSDDLGYPNVISYFIPSVGVNLTGTVKQIPQVEFPASFSIVEAFKLIKDAMHTKGGKLRKGMETLKPHEDYLIISLINYLREEWVDGNRGQVDLTWQEMYFLKEGGFTKAKTIKKKTK